MIYSKTHHGGIVRKTLYNTSPYCRSFPEPIVDKKPNALSGEGKVYITDRLSVCEGGMVNEENPWETNVD